MTSTTHTNPIATEAQFQAQAQAQYQSQSPSRFELRILRIKDVADKLSIGKSTLYDWLNIKSTRYDPSFPKPIKLSTKSIGWLSTEIDAWLLAKITATTAAITTQEPASLTSQTEPQTGQPLPLLGATELHILRIKAVADKLGIGKSTIYDWLDIKSPRYDASFPKPIKLSVKSIGWLSTEIDKWLLQKINPTSH